MKQKVAFVCTHNSCRSIIAEGWAKHLGSDIIEAYSAGTVDYPAPKPMALEVMEDVGVDMRHAKSKRLYDIPSSVDVLITMGCGVECPFVPCLHRADWGIDDPSSGPKKDFEVTRDIIKEKVIRLIERIKEGEFKKPDSPVFSIQKNGD